MDKIELKKQLVDKLEEYLRDRMSISDEIRLDGSFEPITIDELDKVCLEYKDSFNAPEKFAAAKKTKLTEDEINIMFNYLREYLLNNDVSSYPDPRNDGNIFMEVFEKIVEKMTPNDENYDEVNKFLRCTTAMRFTFINQKFSGFIGHMLNFVVEDNNRERFICYGDDKYGKSYVKDFAPIFFHKNLCVCTIEDKETKEKITIFASLENKGFYSVLENELYSYEKYEISKDDNFLISFNNLLNIYGCQFLKREIYKKKEFPQLWNALIKYRDMKQKDKEELDNISTIGAYWWLSEYKSGHFESNINLVNNLVNKLIKKEVITTIEEEKKYINTLRNSIKRSLLEEGRMYLHAEYQVSDELCEAQYESGLHFSPVFAEMEIVDRTIKVSRGRDSYNVIYPTMSFYFDPNAQTPEEGPKI